VIINIFDNQLSVPSPELYEEFRYRQFTSRSEEKFSGGCVTFDNRGQVLRH